MRVKHFSTESIHSRGVMNKECWYQNSSSNCTIITFFFQRVATRVVFWSVEFAFVLYYKVCNWPFFVEILFMFTYRSDCGVVSCCMYVHCPVEVIVKRGTSKCCAKPTARPFKLLPVIHHTHITESWLEAYNETPRNGTIKSLLSMAALLCLL